jgi:hypothetical protein
MVDRAFTSPGERRLADRFGCAKNERRGLLDINIVPAFGGAASTH